MQNKQHELFYRRGDGTVSGDCLQSAASMPLEEAEPFRLPPSFRKQKNLPGLYWFETTGRHLVYESLLEKQILRVLDFDPEVVGVAAQPFLLVIHSGDKLTRYVPDFFVRLSSGAAKVVEVKPASVAAEREAQSRFLLARTVCGEIGWAYEVATEPDEVFSENLGWLAGFCRKPPLLEEFSRALLDLATGGIKIDELVRQFEQEALARPVLFHLLWKHRLCVDLSTPLSGATIVSTRERHRNAR